MLISVRGTKLFVDVLGSEWRWSGKRFVRKPPLFLLHGGPGSNHGGFKGHLDFLSSRFQLFYVDHRGCGLSAPCPKSTLTLRENVEDLEALRRALGFDQISVYGLSYGGMVAGSYATKYHRRLSLLFLVGAAGSHDFLREARAYLARHGTPAQIREAERLWAGEFRSAAQLDKYYRQLNSLYSLRPVPRRVPHPRLKKNLDALNLGFRGFLRTFDVLPALRRVRTPTFVACGKHDWICPVSQSRALARHLPRATLRIFARSGHNPAHDEPAAYRQKIESFIDRWLPKVERLA